MAVIADSAGVPTEEPANLTNSPSLPSSLRSFFLSGPAGKLEALLNEGQSDAPYVTLLCQPHPLGGGTMHNKVVYHAMKVFHGFGWPVLRFNFRGTGLSEGQHDGRAESSDVQAALDWLSGEFQKPIIASGFSFGAAIGLRASCGDSRVHGFAALGLPTNAEGRDYIYPFLPACTFPKLFLSGNRDQYAPEHQLRSVVAEAAEPKHLEFIPGADHFFTGHLSAMQSALSQWIDDSFSHYCKSQI
jgi:alpha/beta superfamily hydrolase